MRKNVVMMKIVVVAIVIFALMSVAVPIGVGEEGTIKWKWETDSNVSISGTPAIGPDGNIYVTAGVGGMWHHWVPKRLFCVSPEGTMLWKSQELDHCGTTDPVIASDGTIYVVGNYKLYAFNPDGTLKWEWEADPRRQIGGLALGTDGTIYTAGGVFVYAINPDGTLKWGNDYYNKYKMGRFKAFTIGKNGDVYTDSWHYSNGTHVICALNPDNGAVLWSTELGDVNQGGMAIGSDGTIYVPLYGTKKLQALNPDGTKKWHYDFPLGSSGIPSIGSDGTIYAATMTNKGLYALASSGELKWTAGQCISPDVAIASDGTIYFCGSDPEARRIPGHERDNYIAVNPDGSTKWTCEIASWGGSPAIGSDGTIYVTGGVRPGVLTAVYGSAPLASSPWPRSRHDNRNTGSYGVIPTPTFTPTPTPAPTPTGAPTPSPTPTPTPDGEQQRLYPVADGRVYAYSYRNWNWANMGMAESMFAGWHPVGGESRAYLRFDLPDGLDISRAVLKLYQYHSEGPVHTLGVYRVTSSWEEGTDTYHSGKVEERAAPGELCWMQQPSFDPVPVATFTSATAVPAWVEVNITSLVQQWQAGTPNYGLVVKTTNEHPTASDPAAWSWYCTKEYPEPDQANRPVLELSLSGTALPPTPTPPPPKECVGDQPYLYVEDRVMGKGKTVEIPIIMCNAKELASMDLDWSYNAAVLKIINVTKGSLNEKALFDWNEVSPGKLKIAFASSKGVTGSDSIAVMKFEVIGNTGDTSTLTGTVTTASKTDGTEISVGVNPGKFTVGTSQVKGDCDGDGELTVKDALVAIQMSVVKLAVDMCCDYNGDGKVDSSDAREILKAIGADQ